MTNAELRLEALKLALAYCWEEDSASGMRYATNIARANAIYDWLTQDRLVDDPAPAHVVVRRAEPAN